MKENLRHTREGMLCKLSLVSGRVARKNPCVNRWMQRLHATTKNFREASHFGNIAKGQEAASDQ